MPISPGPAVLWSEQYQRRPVLTPGSLAVMTSCSTRPGVSAVGGGAYYIYDGNGVLIGAARLDAALLSLVLRR